MLLLLPPFQDHRLLVDDSQDQEVEKDDQALQLPATRQGQVKHEKFPPAERIGGNQFTAALAVITCRTLVLGGLDKYSRWAWKLSYQKSIVLLTILLPRFVHFPGHQLAYSSRDDSSS